MSFFKHLTGLANQRNNYSTAFSNERNAGTTMIALGTKLLVIPPMGIGGIIGGIATMLDANAKAKRLG